MRSNLVKFCALLCAQAVFLLAPAAASALEKLPDVACTSTSFCLAVGASDASGASHVQARGWNGSAWSDKAAPVPDGAALSELSSVSCVSASSCVAVGSYADEEEETTLALAMRWNGSSWSTDSLPAPAGSLSSKLAEVACTSASSCTAVGRYIDAAEVRKSLAMRWNGSAWSLQSAPVPSGAGLSELTGVSCTVASDCVAVGSFVNSSEVTKTLAMVWNGSAWSITSTPEPAGAELSQLSDVSCRPSEACTAVGTYFSSGLQKTLALRRNTSKVWSIQTTPNQAGALSNALSAVSCPAATSCVAVGVIEQGSKELPIALGWNGTTWSQQSIDSEALGASSVELAAISCLSATDCKATGSVAYGRSAADRNLAFSYNGSAWLVSEAGQYERGWLRLDASQASNQLNGISCSAAHICFAVGGSTSDAGVRSGRIGSWSGGDWSVKAAPIPAGATASELSGISCASTTSCKVVGRYADSEHIYHLLVQSWNGTAWSIQSAPTPQGAKAAELSAVDCASSSACAAVGSYLNQSGAQVPLALTYNGTSWSLASVPAAANAVGSWLSGISCASTTACVAVGVQADAFGHEEGFSARRAGSTWTTPPTPELDGNSENVLSAISCAATTDCLAVGRYDDADGKSQNLAIDWDGEKWQQIDAPDEEAENTDGLGAISCPVQSSCVAVGLRPGNSSEPPLIARWDGDSWDSDAPAEFSSGASAVGLAAVSCYSETQCNAVGSASYGGFPIKSFSLAYEEGAWFAPYIPAPGGGLRGVSCPEAESCVAVGDSIDPSGDSATAWSLQDDESWSSAPTTVVNEAFLSDVSCTTGDQCTAIGRQSDWPFKPLAERWDGEGWSTQAIPGPGGRSASPEAISCATASFCVAAGFSWPSTGAGAATALLESWDGSSWQIASPPFPAAAVSTFLYDVSCASASFCAAVGAYTDASGTYHGLIERWNGSSWTSSSISPPGGLGYRLLGVDCTSSSACTTVGASTSTSNGAVAAIAARWNGTAWSTQTVPSPVSSSSSSLRSVDCYSSTRCVAVGASSDPATQNPFVVGWQNGTWQLEPAPQVPGNSSTTLESVSCFSAADCTAVGVAQFADGPRELLVVQTEGEDPESDEPTMVAGGGVAKLSVGQAEAALEILTEDPVLQATIGAVEYDPQIGPWTEIDEETGEIVLVGAFLEIALEDPETWPERTWPAAGYELGANGYEGGAFSEGDLDASASTIETLQINLDLEFDESLNPIEGEAVEIMPLPGVSGEVEISPESLGEYDPAVAGY